jgi:hypothetical protein
MGDLSYTQYQERTSTAIEEVNEYADQSQQYHSEYTGNDHGGHDDLCAARYRQTGMQKAGDRSQRRRQ